MTSWGEELQRLLLTPGAVYACAADGRTGEIISQAGDGSATPAVVVDWGMVVGTVLDDVGDDELEDLMITSRRSYRLLRVLDAGSRHPVLVHLCLDRARSNLALARRELATVRVGTIAYEAATPLSSPLPAAQPPPSAIVDPWRPAVGEGPAPPAAIAVPLPRRVVARPRPAPAPEPAEVPDHLRPVLAQRWSTDRDTLGRLLDALRALS